MIMDKVALSISVQKTRRRHPVTIKYRRVFRTNRHHYTGYYMQGCHDKILYNGQNDLFLFYFKSEDQSQGAIRLSDDCVPPGSAILLLSLSMARR